MAELASPLVTYYKPGWEIHHQAIVKTIASLSSEQLALPVAAHHWSIGELLAHMIGARIWWFHMWMGEENAAIAHWLSLDESFVPDAAELVAMFEETWHVIANDLERWTYADLQHLVSPPAVVKEQEVPHTRQWIIWHVMEHEIHHGGELSLALGTYGIDSFYSM